MNRPISDSNHLRADKIAILDFGAQYTQLIARRVREARVYCEIFPYDTEVEVLRDFGPKGIILSGGPESAYSNLDYKAPDLVFDFGVPILGICYGMQTMAHQLGGGVEVAGKSEFGYAQLRARGHSLLLKDIQDSANEHGHGLLDVWMSHGDKVTSLPPGFKVIASTENAGIAGMADEERGFYGLQFHPEVTHTMQGQAILERFVVDICKCGTLWTEKNIISNLVLDIRKKVAKEKVLLGLSGGVDSSVVAFLMHAAIGEQLTCVFVDNGLLRKNEAVEVMRTFSENMGLNVLHVDARGIFYKALEGISDPEEKRRVIGHTFIDVFDQEASKIKGVKWLAQGTIYPDVVESAATKTGKGRVIKSHHNVGGLPEQLPFDLIEPLRELFKDEVRRVGLELGLPKKMIFRHPFPGPGLGVRILGEVTEEKAETLRNADSIFIEELNTQGLYDTVSQAFAVFLPVRSVGVKGDARTYEHVIVLRAVETVDFMTAKWARLPYDFLENVSRRIINEVEGVSRVAYDISGKPPATIEWE
jgi:GMP synthase (glutamine-hydrolysing)